MMHELVVTCARGTEDLVAHEVARLVPGKPGRTSGAITARVQDNVMREAMRLCLELRTAQRVLLPLHRYEATDADALYEGAREIAWEDHLTLASTFAISATSRAAPPLANGVFLAQKVKDAVCDRMRERLGARPDVDPKRPDVAIYVHVTQKRKKQSMGTPRVTVGLDVAGRGLHRRGYRAAQVEAPLRETLGAAVIRATGWQANVPFVDPMCGSATLAIEAALMACDVAPGLATGRPASYGFENWPGFDRDTWRELTEAAHARARNEAPVAIVASDHDPDVVAAARACVAAAHPAVTRSIRLEAGDVKNLSPLEPPGIVCTNPPYGARLNSRGMHSFWRHLGSRLRQLNGHQAYLLVHGPDMKRELGMRPSWCRRLMNGPLAIELCRYELGRQR